MTNTITLETPPTTQPNPGTELSDEEIMSTLKKYQAMAEQKGLLSQSAAPKKKTGETHDDGDDDDNMPPGKKVSKSSSPNPEVETIAQAMFSDKTSQILAIDADFPVDIVSKLSVPTTDKIAILQSLMSVAKRHKDGIEAIKAEFANQKPTTSSPSVPAPASGSTPGEQGGKTGAERVSLFASKMGAESLLPKKETK